jgi:hypothetical protein
MRTNSSNSEAVGTAGTLGNNTAATLGNNTAGTPGNNTAGTLGNNTAAAANNGSNMTNYTTSLSLRVASRAASTSPNRTITNGSIRNGNINRNSNNFHSAPGGSSGEVNGNNSLNSHHHHTMPSSAKEAAANNGFDEKFEVPLPFGYHLDLDFLRVCSDDPSGETLEKLKELRKMRRKQRKTLEALMGFRQQQELRTVPEVTRPARIEVGVTRPARPVDLQLASRQPDIVNSSELVREALR